jgi:isopentenyl diphosphate isomerase/L-lactate dehydrogenase-like FMN-dependent dehydrogenase
MAANLAAFRAWRLRAFAINGRAGVERLLRFLAADLARTLVLLGAESTGQLGPRFLQREMGAR